jgi:hypothetical protein
LPNRDLMMNQSDPSLETDITALGISNVPYDVFFCGQYRYTGLEDALAQGRRAGVSDSRTNGEIEPASNKDAEAAQYGISKVTVDRFIFGPYRYSRLDDALAEATRHPASTPQGTAAPDRSQVRRFRRKARQLEAEQPKSRFETR